MPNPNIPSCVYIYTIYTYEHIYTRIYYTNQQQKLLESLRKNTPEYGFIWSG